MIPYGKQNINQNDIEHVISVLNSDFLTQGPIVPQFEGLISKRCGVKYSVAVNSATSALHIACLSLELGVGDWLWTTPNSFVASANCALYCGAKVDFVDIDPMTFNMSVEALQHKLELAEINGRLPKIVIPVHFAGQSCDMKVIKKLSDIYGFKIIEDASHAIGGEYNGNRVGNCKYSDISVFSFHPVKIITTGEGGMALTNNPDLDEKMRLLRSHGVTRDKSSLSNSNEGSWYYEQIMLGFNYRMTDIHAALGISQLQRLDLFIEERMKIASEYNTSLAGMLVDLPFVHENVKSAWHLYVIKVPGERRRVFEDMQKSGIGVNIHYIPIHLQPYYQKLGFKKGQFPEAEKYYEQALSLPIFPDLQTEQQAQVIDSLKRSLK